MYKHLKEKQYYENLYDCITVESGRKDSEMFNRMYDEFFKIMPDEPKDSHRAVLHLNLIYVVGVGNRPLNRFDNRDEHIQEMMAKDELKDQQITSARLAIEPKCQQCGVTGLRITDKMLHHRKSFDEVEEVLFMLKCIACNKNNAVWVDGTQLERHKELCPKCSSIMDEKTSRRGKIITTTYTCTSCSHSYKDKLTKPIKKSTIKNKDAHTIKDKDGKDILL